MFIVINVFIILINNIVVFIVINVLIILINNIVVFIVINVFIILMCCCIHCVRCYFITSLHSCFILVLNHFLLILFLLNN